MSERYYYNPQTGYTQNEPYTGAVPFRLSDVVSSGYDPIRGYFYCGGRPDMKVVQDLQAAGYTEWKFQEKPREPEIQPPCYEPVFTVETDPKDPAKTMTHEELPPIFDMLREERFAKIAEENYEKMKKQMLQRHQQDVQGLLRSAYQKTPKIYKIQNKK